MPIYTGVADANGDFNIPFSSNYTGGQKITVIAEKDAAIKTIEIFAPSEIIGNDSAVTIHGSMIDYPVNIEGVTISSGNNLLIPDDSFAVQSSSNVFSYAKLLSLASSGNIGKRAFKGWLRAEYISLPDGIDIIDTQAFRGWENCKALTLPDTVTTVAAQAFYGWEKAIVLNLSSTLTYIGDEAFYNFRLLKTLELPASLLRIGGWGFENLLSCIEIKSLANTPPLIESNTFSGLNAGCIFKVPVDSVAAYQAAPNWSAFAARIQAI